MNNQLNPMNTNKQKKQGASRLDWLFPDTTPAFIFGMLLGGLGMFALVWQGPVAVRDKVIRAYEADTLRLARELDAEKAGSMLLTAQLLALSLKAKNLDD